MNDWKRDLAKEIAFLIRIVLIAFAMATILGA